MKVELYHGTNPTNLKSILKSGFKDRVASGKSNWADDIKSKEGFVYLTNAYPFFYAMSCSRGKVGSVIKVEVDTKDLYPDEDFLAQALHYERDEIKNIDIVKYKHSADLSLQYLGNVCIRAEKIKKILGHREFNVGEAIRYSDPSITIMNYKIMGEYYRNLTDEWFKTGKFSYNNNFEKV